MAEQTHVPLVTAEAMAEIDALTIERGIPGPDLMARAGRGVWDVTADRYGTGSGTRVVILCGKGNNGGDGFVVARAARRDGLDPVVILFADENDVSRDAAHHFRLAREAGVDIRTWDAPDGHHWEGLLDGADILVDALLGTGISGALRPPFDRAVNALRTFDGPVVAVDTPSGMDADSGEGDFAPARLTVTFGALKPCHVYYPGRQGCGDITLVDIGLDEKAIADRTRRRVSFAVADPVLPVRVPTAHKGNAGRVLVVAGSVGMTGAGCLTAEAALRAGAGLVTLGLPASLNDIVEVKLTEVMTRPLPEVRKSRCLSLRARGDLRRLIAGTDVVALGPGVGRHRETAELVRRLIDDIDTNGVLDADGLNALDGGMDRLKDVPGAWVLTPHPGEFERLTGRPVTDPAGDAERLADRIGHVVVLKGAPTVIARPGRETCVNTSGNAGMATGGTGDVLTGVIAALIGQGMAPGDAAVAGVYWHGLAGDIAADNHGQRGLIAGSVVEAIPAAERLIADNRGHRRYLRYRPLDDDRQSQATESEHARHE